MTMEVLHPRCAGLDVHKDSVVACVRSSATSSWRPRASIGSRSGPCCARRIGFSSWPMLTTSKPCRAGTDVNDATWLADLLGHGLIRPSFVPPMEVQALRELTRTRKQLARERASHVQRIDKLLQAANLKLGSVLSDIMGQSGRAVLDALAAGESDPERLADLVRTKVRASRAQLTEALRGRLADHQRLLLGLHLAQADAITAAIGRIDAESMQTRGDWLPVELGFGLTERGWAGAEAGVACEAGGGAASRRDDRDRGRAH